MTEGRFKIGEYMACSTCRRARAVYCQPVNRYDDTNYYCEECFAALRDGGGMDDEVFEMGPCVYVGKSYHDD